jgi:molecular chaperone DnaK
MARPSFSSFGHVTSAGPPRQIPGTLIQTSVCVSIRAQNLFFERLDLRLTIDADLIVAVEARSALTGDRDADEIYDLEFSLGTDTLVQGKVPPDSKKTKKNHRASDVRKAMPAGAVCMRSNVSVRPGRKELVPGELLYQVDPGSFDRRNPQPLPQICVDERLYYEPCSICGRRYNHPECSCASQLPH